MQQPWQQGPPPTAPACGNRAAPHGGHADTCSFALRTRPSLLQPASELLGHSHGVKNGGSLGLGCRRACFTTCGSTMRQTDMHAACGRQQLMPHNL